MSSHGELPVTPAGTARGTDLPWKVMWVVPLWRRVRIRRSSAKERLPPAESPAKTICDGSTGV